MKDFDLLGPLPEPRSTIVLEASAGTGKTFALAGLVTRYIAEGMATLDQMLLITFNRTATYELRERVRGQIVEALEAYQNPSAVSDNLLVARLLEGTPEQLRDRRQRLRDALAGFDAATIATTHQFCHLVLKSLGVAGDTDSGATLVENLDDLVTEIVDDLYLAHFGRQPADPALSRGKALELAREVVANPSAELRPLDPAPGSEPAARVDFARAVTEELERRKRSQGVFGYDDLLSRLATALQASPDAPGVPDAPARARMRRRWSIVMVDEFQDTDPVQWQVIDRAFSGHSTLILIGDPKQAIYAFRGGDVVTYLDAASTAGTRQTLGINWRSDGALVERLQAVMRDAQLGDPEIVVHQVRAHHRGHRLAGAPHNEPFRLRVVARDSFATSQKSTIAIAELREHIGADLAADIGNLLAADATFDGDPLQARDIAVIVENHKDGHACFDALTAAGIPAVYTGDQDVFASPAADDWLCLLEAFDQPHRSGIVRAAATTMFFGETAETLAVQGDTLTERITERVRSWADHARERGVAAVFEEAQLTGMSDRVLSWYGGERHLTDLAHLAQILQDTGHREHYGLPALRDWLRTQREERTATERNRRLDSDAAAVQIMTVWMSKGLQFPVVYLPFAFNRNYQTRDAVLFHDDGVRCLHIGGAASADHATVTQLGRRESAGDDVRLTYVALTRAQSQVVAWWAPSFDEPNGGLSRLLRGREPGDPVIKVRCEPAKISDADAIDALQAWADAGGPVLENSVIAAAADLEPRTAPSDLAARHFHRHIDASWRRTSYSGLIRAAETAGVSSEPEATDLSDEGGDNEGGEAGGAIPLPGAADTDAVAVLSPMSDLPAGAKFGSLVHAVLETADPFAADLAAEFEKQIREHSVWWPVEVDADVLAAALVPMHDTPLGPLASGRTLRQIGLRDRLREMEFEMPLAGGDRREAAPAVTLADVGRLLAEHLSSDHDLARYPARLCSPELGEQSLRGYLTGSVDAVLRIDDRFLVVDYKTNWLGEPERPLTAADYGRPQLAEAMLHSDYPLQALLYCVALHRFLRWRVPNYSPGDQLGGVLYLFVRGMCGSSTPVVDEHPAGVFSWLPPAELIVALSDLLDAGATP